MRAAAALLCVLSVFTLALAEEDLYETLGVPRDATRRTIKKEYHRLARAYHPDKHPGDAKMEAKFKKISRAYEVLYDADQRQKYDNFGLDGLKEGGGGGGGGGFHHGGFHFGGGGPGMQFDEEMFRGFFGGGGGSGGFGGGGFGGGFGGGGGFRQRERQRERVCQYNKICERNGCKLKRECKVV